MASLELWQKILAFSVVGVVTFGLLFGGPIAGYLIMRSRRKAVDRMRVSNEARYDDFFSEPAPIVHALPAAKLQEEETLHDAPVIVMHRSRVTGALELMSHAFDPEPVPEVAELPTRELTWSTREQWQEAKATAVAEHPEWLYEGTTEHDTLEYLDGEIVVGNCLAEEAFLNDPLGSWVAPPEALLEADEYLPEANRVFEQMVSKGWLTGEGADLDAEWKAWNLEGANA